MSARSRKQGRAWAGKRAFRPTRRHAARIAPCRAKPRCILPRRVASRRAAPRHAERASHPLCSGILPPRTTSHDASHLFLPLPAATLTADARGLGAPSSPRTAASSYCSPPHSPPLSLVARAHVDNFTVRLHALRVSRYRWQWADLPCISWHESELLCCIFSNICEFGNSRTRKQKFSVFQTVEFFSEVRSVDHYNRFWYQSKSVIRRVWLKNISINKTLFYYSNICE